MSLQREQGADYVAFATMRLRFSGVIKPDVTASSVLERLTSPESHYDKFEMRNVVYVMKAEVSADLGFLIASIIENLLNGADPDLVDKLRTLPSNVICLRTEQEMIDFFGA